MKSFYYYLKSKEQKESTIQQHIYNVEQFIKWAKESGRDGIEQMNYTELLEYVQHEKEKKVQVQTINLRLNSIRQYYDHLKEENRIEKNPARRLHIKGAIKKIITNPLSYAELEKLYHDYCNYLEKQPVIKKTQLQSRPKNKLLLSLMIWQGLHSGELGKLRIESIQLSKGILDVPGTARSNGRKLSLTPSQIIPLHDYIKNLPSYQEKLFIGNLHNHVTLLVNEITGINPQIQNAAHIRASVVMHWIKIYDKRKVQHMLGHKHISSTERYECQELDTLTDQLNRFHPFS